ncbi:hypothetical protein BH23GEM6_BH23GEM6_26530 [soil metagenome]
MRTSPLAKDFGMCCWLGFPGSHHGFMGTNLIREQTYRFALANITVARDLTERRE